MAKLQRWRRRDRAGEGDSPVEVDEDATTGNEPDGPGVDPGESASRPDGSTSAEVEDVDDVVIDDLEDEVEIPESQFRANRSPIREWPLLALLQALHPKQAVVTALGLFMVAILAGRPAREAGIVLVTVLVGQAIIGLHNDLVDRRRDAAHEAPGKPLADGRLSVADGWTALILLVLLLIPLAITTGIVAGFIYMGSVAIATLGHVLFRTSPLALWSWAVSFGMFPAYITYGGWGGQAMGGPPETAMVVLFALLGIGIHVIRSVWGLVADHQDGWTHLPLKLGLKLGATRLLAVATIYLAIILIAMAIVGSQVGIHR
jgi:4-hydroxybenzoate polyprenyltransferase